MKLYREIKEIQDTEALNTTEVKVSFLNYLKTEFPYKKSWIHPATNEIHTHETIKNGLLKLKNINPEYYRVLWAMWTTRMNLSLLSTRFYCSATTIKRTGERAIDILMLILYYPELYIELLELYY